MTASRTSSLKHLIYEPSVSDRFSPDTSQRLRLTEIVSQSPQVRRPQLQQLMEHELWVHRLHLERGVIHSQSPPAAGTGLLKL